MERRRVSTGTKWERLVGYSRAVQIGPHVFVSGTTGTDEEGEVVGVGDPYSQTVQALVNVEKALVEAGAGLSDVVRTRLYLVDIGDWEEVGRAHGDFLSEVRPATTLVQVEQLVEPEMLVEVEADAFVG